MIYSHSPRDYKIITVIGHGCFGAATVSLSKYLPNSSIIALKKTYLEDPNVDFAFLQHEVITQRQIFHPNILPTLKTFVAGHYIWNAMPLMGYGSCKDLVHAHFKTGLPEAAIAIILHEVLQALYYLHSRAVIHRSVRASHVLIAADGRVCLTGLRHSLNMVTEGERLQNVHEFPEHYTHSLLWACPELLEQNMLGYNTSADIYSLGITACEIANGIVPFSDVSSTEMLLQKLRGCQPVLLDASTIGDLINAENPGAESSSSADPPFQRQFSEQFHMLVDTCLQRDPKLRPTAGKLCNNTFFRNVRRRSGSSPTLPDLLQPVKPLDQIIHELPQADEHPAIDAITENFRAAVLSGDWDFSL